MDNEAITIAILVIVCVILLFQVELYRNILNIMSFHSPEAPPPRSLLYSGFLSTNKQKPQKK